MKKAIFGGIALAAVTLTSAAYAESADSSDSARGMYLTASKTGGEYVNGANVTFSVKVTQNDVTKGGFMVKTEGLELVSSKVEGGKFDAGSGAATFSGVSYAKDSVAATFTYKVIAKTGENVRFAISEHADYPGAVDSIPVTGIVTAGTSSGTSSAPSIGNSGANSGGNSNGTAGNPTTGAALTVIPVILTGAAIIVAARKRK